MAKRPDIKAAEDHIRAHVFYDPDLEHNVVAVIEYMNALEREMFWMGNHGGLSIEAVHLIEQTGAYKHNADFVKVPMAPTVLPISVPERPKLWRKLFR